MSACGWTNPRGLLLSAFDPSGHAPDQLISELPTGAETGRSSQKSRTSEVEYVAAAAACDQ